MNWRGAAKKLVFGSAPFLRGRFNYYKHIVFFPLGSHIFERACAEVVYERDITNLVLAFVEAGTTYFDVGANIGLLSVPVLATHPDVKVVSVEASPDTLPFLQKTRSLAKRMDDWTIVGSAVGSVSGEADFCSGGGAMGAFDGLMDTGRGGTKRTVRVPIRTLDEIWREVGSPAVSVIKMDIEGGELAALNGARNVIQHTKPILIVEWTDKNLAVYGIDRDQLLVFCDELEYSAFSYPHLIAASRGAVLKMAMEQTETFVLVPRGVALVS
jgi:FkbM family methyltransferase